MKLVPNAKEVLKHSASVKLWAVAAILEGLSLSGPLLLPHLAKFFESQVVSLIAMGFIVAGMIARFIKQEKVSG